MENDPLLQAQDRLMHLRKSLETNSDNSLLSLRATGRCVLCGSELAADRQWQCQPCDVRVDDYWRERNARTQAETAERNMRLSKLPKDYATGERKTGDLPGSTHAALSACQSLGNGVRGLYLYGEAGTFKTSLAAAFLASQIRGGAMGRYVPMHDLLADIHLSYRSDDADSKHSLVERCVTTPCLVLDDLGKEKPSEHAAMVLFEILDGRYRNNGRGHWMIVTSNYDLEALCDKLPSPEIAAPIKRRLSEMTVALEMKR